MDKLRQLYNRLVANGMTKTPTFEEWVANRKEEDYEIISGDYPEINTFRDKNDYLTTLRLYKKPEEIETPKTEVKVEKPVETPEYPFGKVEFGKQPPIKNGGVRTTSEEKKQLLQNKTAPIGEAPSNLTKITTTEQVKSLLPEGVSVGMEKMNIEARGLEALQKAETIQRNEIIKEVGLYPENFQEGTPYDIGRKLYKINGLPENEQQQKIAELGITPFPEDVEELGTADPFGFSVYKAFQEQDKQKQKDLLTQYGEQTVNKALNEFSNKAINKSLNRSINQYLDYEGKIKERADDKVLIQNSLKKLEERKNEGMTFGQGYKGREQDIALEEKLRTNPVLTPDERMVLETLSGQTPKGNYLFANPVEYQKLQYLNDPNPDKKITPDIELDLKLNNPNYKLAVWDETDTKRFLDVNPDLSPTPENKKEYWKERDRSNPYAKAWLDNPMIMSDKYEELFQTQEVQAAGEAMGKKYGALLSQYGESPKEKMEAYWNLAMSRYLELMPIVEEQSIKPWNASVLTPGTGSTPYDETGESIIALTNQIASLFYPGEKGVFTNEQIEFIALTNKLRALTPMVVSGKLPTESKALDNSWLTDFTNRFASGVEQIGTPGSVSAKTRGLLTNDAIASLYEAGVMENLTPAKSKEIELATSEERGLWSRKWMINPESLANFGGNLVGIAAPIMIIPSPLGKMEAIEGIGIARGSKIAKVLFNESGKLNFIGKVANTAQKSAQMGLDYEARGQVMGAIGKKQYQEELNFGTGFVGGVGRFVLDDALGIAGKALKKKLNVTSEAIEKGAGRIFGNSSKEITEETLQEMYQSWVRADGDFATWQKDMFGKDGVFGSWNKSLGFLVGIGAAGWMDGYSTEDTKNLMLKAAKANNIPNAEEVVQEFVEGLQESEKNGIANIGQDGEKLIFQDKNGAQYTTEKGLDGQITVTPIGVVENPDIEGVRLVAEELYSQGGVPETIAPVTPEVAPPTIAEQIEQKRVETEGKIQNKGLFQDGGLFANELGGSGVDSVPTGHYVENGIEFVQFSNPITGDVDVIMTGTSDHDFVGYYRVYENGKPTNKWSSKFENQSRNKENFKTMISNAQAMLPEGHEYTESTSISTDGLRVWGQQLNRGYELQYDKEGNLITNEVAINGDALVNELGIPVEVGAFSNISVTNDKDFEKVKAALLPYLAKFGLSEKNIRNVNGTVVIDLPVLKSKPKTPEVVAPEPVAPSEQNRRRGEKQIKAAFNKLNEAKTPEEQLDAINLLERNEREGAKLTKDEKQQIQKAKDNLSANGYEMPELLGKQFHQGLKVIVTSSIPDENLAEGEEVISKVITPTINKSYTQEEIDNLEVKINEATGEISYYDKNHDITYYSKPKVGEEKMVRTGQIEVTVGTKKGGLTREQWLKERNNTQTPVTQEQAAPETKEKITPEVVAPIEEAAPEIVSEETPKNEGKETTVQPEGEKKAIERKKPIPKTQKAVTEKEGRLVNSKGEVLESNEEMYDEIASKSYDADEIAKAIEERKVATVEQTDENIIEEFLPLLDMKSKDVSENVTDPIARGKAGKQTLDGLIESINEQHPGRFDDELRNKILDQLSQKPDKKAKDPTLAKLEKRYFDITGKKYVKPKPAQEVSFKQKEELDELKKKRAEKVAKGFTTVKIDNRIAELEEGMKAEALKAEATEIEKAEEEAWNKEAAEMARIEAAIERELAEIAANPNRSQEKIKRLRKLKQKAVEKAKEVAPETTEEKPEAFDWDTAIKEAEERTEEEKEQDAREVVESEREEAYQKSTFDKKWAKTYKEAKAKVIKAYNDAKKEKEKWEAKTYKSSGGKTVLVGDEMEGSEVEVDSINKKRRERAIKNAQADMDSAKGDLVRLGLTDDEIKEVLSETTEQKPEVKQETKKEESVSEKTPSDNSNENLISPKQEPPTFEEKSKDVSGITNDEISNNPSGFRIARSFDAKYVASFGVKDGKPYLNMTNMRTGVRDYENYPISDESGRPIRYVIIVVDKANPDRYVIMSYDGWIRLTNPSAWERIKKYQSNTIESQIMTWELLSKEDQDAFFKELLNNPDNYQRNGSFRTEKALAETPFYRLANISREFYDKFTKRAFGEKRTSLGARLNFMGMKVSEGMDYEVKRDILKPDYSTKPEDKEEAFYSELDKSLTALGLKQPESPTFEENLKEMAAQDVPFEQKYGVSDTELYNEYNSMDRKNVDLQKAYENLTGKKAEDYDQLALDFVNAVSKKGLALKSPVAVEKGEIEFAPIPAKPLTTSGVSSLGGVVLGKDDGRLALQGIYVDGENYVATDTNKLVIIKAKESVEELLTKFRDAIIKAYTKIVGLKAATESADKTIDKLKKEGVNNKILNFREGFVVDAKYPNYNNVIPINILQTAVESIDKWIEIANGARLALKNGEGKAMAIQVTGATTLEIGVNPENLLGALQALKANGAKTIEIGIYTPSRAITIHSDNGNLGLVMPVMLALDSNRNEIVATKPIELAVSLNEERANEKIKEIEERKPSTFYEDLYNEYVEKGDSSMIEYYAKKIERVKAEEAESKEKEINEIRDLIKGKTPKSQNQQITPKSKRATIPFIEATKRVLNKLFGNALDISYDVMAHYEAYKAAGASKATLDNILVSSAFVSDYRLVDGKLVRKELAPDAKTMIVFNPEKIKENTAGHELFHVWFEGIKASAKGKEMIDRAVKLITTKGEDGKYINPKMQQIENTAGYAGHDEEYKAEEALAELIGDAMKALLLGNFTAWEAFQHSLDKSVIQRDIIGAVKDMLKYLKTKLAPFFKFMADKKGDSFNSFDFTLGDFAEYSAKDIMAGNNVSSNKSDIHFQLPETRLEYNLDGSLKTPFGKPSELEENQWRVVRTPAFKNWFGDWEKAAREYRDRKYPTFEKALKANGVSMVVNQNTGEPLVVYHRTDAEFSVFDNSKAIYRAGFIGGALFYFSSDRYAYASYGHRELICFISLKNPTTKVNIGNEYIPKSNDGAILVHDMFGDKKTVVVATNPTQIKLADGSNTTFSPTNPDIRFQLDDIYHGSPRNIDRFSTDYLERYSDYGWGIYLTDDKGVARQYSEGLPQYSVDESKHSKDAVNKGLEELDFADGDKNEAISNIKDSIQNYKSSIYGTDKQKADKIAELEEAIKVIQEAEIINPKYLYTTTLFKGRSHTLLDDNKPVDDKILDKISKAGYTFEKGITGGQLYYALTKKLNSDKKAVSLFLLKSGIDGIRFPAEDNNGHRLNNGKFNYVVFDENAITIEDKIKFQLDDIYHGSPHDFDRFSTANIGTGEGAQAFGWGLYFTDLEEIGRQYANMRKGGTGRNLPVINNINRELESIGIEKYDKYDLIEFADTLIEYEGDFDRALDRLSKFKKHDKTGVYEKLFNDLSKLPNNINLIGERVLYKTTLHKGKKPNEYTWLEWDKPVPKNIMNDVGEKLIHNGKPLKDLFDNSREYEKTDGTKVKGLYPDGLIFYKRISQILGGDKEASIWLLKQGIDGIKYPAESLARRTTSDTARGFNYVVFDENAVTIEDKIKFQIIGENSNMDAQTRKNLNIAKRMDSDGLDPEKIWLATGWEMGVDGKWRYEIPDNKPKNGLVGILKGNPKGLTLSDILTSKPLYEAYPQLKDIKVKIKPMERGENAHYNSQTNEIVFNEIIIADKGVDPNEAIHSTLIHEVQHAIQRIEGFARGGNETEFVATQNLFAEMKERLELIIQVDELANKNKVSPREFVDKAGYTKKEREYLYSVTERFDDWKYIVSIAKDKLLTPRQKYRRLAGEVEARNVETRAKMPMSERRVKPISRTEDVSRDNQIVMFDNPKFQLPEDAKFQLPERSRTALNEMEFEGGYDWVEDYETTDDEGRKEIRQNFIEYLEGLGDPEAEAHVDDYLAEKFPTPLPVPLPENKEGGTGKQAVRKFSDNLRKFADNLSGKFRDFVLGYKPAYNRIADDVQLAKAIAILEQAISDKVRSKAEAHVKYMPISEEEKEAKMTEYLEQMDTNPQFRYDVISEAFDDFVEKNLKEEGADLPDEPARIVAAMIILRNVTEREEALRKSGKIKEADALLDKARLLADKIAYVGTMAGRMVRVFAMWSTLSTGGAMSLIKANLKAIHDAHFDKDGNPTDLYGQSVKFVESLEKGLKEALKTQWVDLSGKIGDLRTELSSLNVENDKMKKVIDRIQRHWDDAKSKLEEERKDRAKLVQEQVRKAMQNTGTTQGKSVTQKTTQNTNKTGIVSTLRKIFMSGIKAQIDASIMDAIKTPAGLQAITDAIKDELNKGRSFAQARANIIADFISEGVMKMDDIGSADFEIIMDAFEVAKVSLKVDGTVALAKAMLGDAVTDPVTGGDILIRGLQARMSDVLENILPQDVTEEQAKEVALNAINDEVFINTLLEELKTLKDPIKGLKELNQLRTDNGFAPIGGQKKSDFLQSVRGKTKAQIAAEIRTRIAEAMKTDRPLNEQLMDDMGIDKATADMLTALVNEELRAQAMTDVYKVLDSIIDSIETMEKKGKKALLDTAMKAFHVKTKDGLREKLFQLIAVSSGNKDLTEEVVNRLKGALGIDYFSSADIEALEKLKEAADKAPQGRMKEWANKQFLNEAVKRMAGGTGKYNLRLLLYRGGYWALFYPAMLSGFSTHLINTESNLFILLSDFINGAIRSLWDKHERAGLWAMFPLNPRTAAKAIQSAWDAFWMGEGRTDTASGSMQKDLVNAMRPTTDPMKASWGNFFLMAVYGFMPGIGVMRALKKGDYQLVSMATRLLGALDRFIMVYHVERNRAVLASRVGDTYEGISNKVIDNTLLDGQTIGSILASEESLYDQYGGTPAIWKRIRRDELYSEALNRRAGYADVADDYARVRALRSPVTGTLGILARAINSVIADKPILRLLVPFVNTTFNYMNLSLSKTPLLFAHMAGYSLSRAYAGVSSIKYDLGNLTTKQEAIADSINEEAMALTGKPFPTNKLKEEVRLRELGAGRENDPSLAFRFRYKAEQARVIWKNLEAQPSTPEIDEQIKKYQQIEKAYIAAADLERGREKVSAMFVGASMVMFALYVMAAAAILGDEPEKEILPGLTAKEIIGMIKITGTKVGERFSGQMREQATEPVMTIWILGRPFSYRQTLYSIELAQLGAIQDQLEAEMKKPKKDRKGFGKLTATAMLESTAGLLYSASGLQGGIGVLQLIADIGEGKPERVRDRMIKFGTPMLLIPNISKQTARLATGGNVYYAGDDIGDIATNVFYKATNVAFIDPMQPRISEIDGKRVISLPGEMGGEIFFQSVVKPQLEWRMSNPTHLWLSSNNLYSAIPERRYSGANVDIIVENEEGEEYFDKAQMTPAQFNKYIETTATAAFKDLTGMVKTNKFVLNKAITRKQWASIPELKGKTKKLEGNKYSITATPAEFEQLALKGLWDTPSAEWSKKLKGERNVQWWAMEKVVRTLYKDKNSEYLKKIKPIMRK